MAKRTKKPAVKAHTMNQSPEDAQDLPRFKMLGELMYSNPWLTRATKAQVFNPALLLKSKGYQELFRMRKDEQVKAALKFKKLVALSSGYCVKHAEGLEEDPIADFVWDVLDKLPGRFEVALREMLSALDFGFSVSEKVYTMDGARAVLKGVKTRHPADIIFEMDPFGNVLGLRQISGRTGIGDKGLMPTGKFVIYTHDGEFGNPYGTSDLEAAYVAYFQKDNSLVWMSQLLERYGVPPAIIRYRGYNTQQMNALNDILDRMASSTVIALPMADKEDSVQIDFPEVASQVQNTFIPALTYADQRIAKALLMPGLMGLTSDTSEGSYSRAQVHFDAFMLVVEALRQDLRNVVQEQIINQLCELNFPEREEGWPQFDFEPIGDEMKLEFLGQWAALAGAGIVTKQPEDEEHIRRQMRMPDLVEREPEEIPVPPAPPAGGQSPEAATSGDTPPEPPSPAAPIDVPLAQAAAPLPVGADVPSTDEPAKEEELAEDAAEEVKLSRPLVECERQVDFANIAGTLSGMERETVAAVGRQYAASKEQLAQLIRDDFADGQLDTVQNLTALPGVDTTMPATISASLQDAFRFGRLNVVNELGANYTQRRDFITEPNYVPEDAVAYLEAKAVEVAGITNQRILGNVKMTLLNAIKQGTPLDEVISNLDLAFEGYLDADPARLETIVRTNFTDAFNQGRLVQSRQAEEDGVTLTGFMYSAIIDARTTEVCRFLDRKIFKADDPDLDRLTPPRHFNCRSVLVTLTPATGTIGGSFITDAEKIEAFSLSASGFTHDCSEHKTGEHNDGTHTKHT